MASTSILKLSESVATNTAKYNEYLIANALPLPSHEPQIAQRPARLPPDIVSARDTAIQASYELHELLVGPDKTIQNSFWQMSRMLSLDFIHTHKIGQSLAMNEKTTFEGIAKENGLDPHDVKRVLRLGMTNHIFCELEPGVVAHTAASYALATNPGLTAWVGVVTKEHWPAFLRVTEALTKWPGSQNPLETAFSPAHGFTDLPFVEWEKDPPRAKQFADAMQLENTAAEPQHILAEYDFSDKEAILFVDVGGSHGETSIALAEKHPQVSCMVQDLLGAVEHAEARIPQYLKGRIKFMAHDFWTEQPVKGADIYFFRWIFHDWPDEYAVKILRQIIPALKLGARIIINDACVPRFGVLPMKHEMELRTMDVLMKAFTNAKERDADDWQLLFKAADSRFRFLGISTPPGARESIIQAEWRSSVELNVAE